MLRRAARAPRLHAPVTSTLGPTNLQMLAVVPLSQVAALRALVSEWLACEWPGWYGNGGPGDLPGDIEAFSRSYSVLPVGLVVFKATQPVGFGALKQQSIPTHTHLSPWAATGFVLPQYRGHGIGAFLLRAIVDHARVMGFSRIYCGTSTAQSLLDRAGWQLIERVQHAGKPLGIYQSGA
jgi:GNAT superfamily N-acetyltransferase